ncbi:MAG: smc 2 [Mucilaginibacter sp.]|nr:smc 2 [Mucilaginibacter sp.]
MANDNKISIDVTVIGDGQQQIDKYVQSFDSLRNSINGLSRPFNSFSNNLSTLNKNLSKYTESLSKLNDQHNDAASGSDKMYDKVTNASSSFVLWNEVIKVMIGTLKGWGVALSGGLGIITAFLPEIINFATALFKGKDAISAMAANFKNLNEVMKASNKDAATEITRLQISYSSA